MKPAKDEVIVKIIGGLGNQMFQYAYARQLALKTNAKLKLDINDFKNYEFHSYSLQHFRIQENYASEQEANFFKKYKKRKGWAGKLLNPFLANPRLYIDEPTYTVSKEMFEVTPPCYVEGYMQSEQYFQDIEEIIRREFTLKEPLSEYSQGVATRIQAASEPVSLHIRRGDFARHATVSKFHGICPPEYYEETIRRINEQIPNPTYFVFSDDIEWARENITTGHSTEFIGQGPDKNYEDLELMRLCKHHILSNSTFGWWGAWLSNPRHTGGVTIAPTKWFNKAFDTKDLIPQDWIKLPY